MVSLRLHRLQAGRAGSRHHRKGLVHEPCAPGFQGQPGFCALQPSVFPSCPSVFRIFAGQVLPLPRHGAPASEIKSFSLFQLASRPCRTCRAMPTFRTCVFDHGCRASLEMQSHVGGCQNYGPCLDPYHDAAPNI